MQRVVIIGCGGAGKSTLARQLGKVTGLPVIHLDVEHWKPGWLEPSREDWAAKVAELTARERWIMDGNYGGTMEQRISRADTVVFLDISRWRCLYRITKRRIVYRGRSRPDMTQGNSERLTWQFVTWVWRYRETRRPGIIELLHTAKSDGKRVFVLRNQRAVERFLGASSPGADAPAAFG